MADAGTGSGRATLPLLVGLVLLALVLRGPVVAVSPVAASVRDGLGIDPVAFGLLTSVPVLCFGLAAPLALVVVRLAGPEGAVLICIGGVVAGCVLRALGGYALAIAATVLLGIAITIGNVVVPALVRRDLPPERRAAGTGVFTAGLNIGSMLAAVSTAPLAAAVGWRPATAAAGGVGIVAAAFWIVLLRRHRAVPPPPAASTEETAVGRRALVVLLSLTFAAQASSYYGLTAWLPTLLGEEQHLGAAAAGVAAAVFQISALLGALGVPGLLTRIGTRWTVLSVGLCWCALPAGLLAAPGLFLLWSVFGGTAQGGGFVAIFAVIVRVAAGERSATRVSAIVQTAGYTVAAAAPPLLGHLRQTSGGWAAPVASVLAATIVFTIVGVLAAVRSDRAPSG